MQLERRLFLIKMNTWNKKFEKTMNHTYMVLHQESFFEEASQEDYRREMLLHNRIPGLLPVADQMMNGENSLYYEISSLVSIEEFYQGREMDFWAVRELLLGCMKVFSGLEEYLLDSSQLILTPEYIYIHPETKKPQFTFYPKYDKDARQSFMELIDYVLTNLDHSDEETVMLGYQVYRITRNPNFTMQELEPFLLSAKSIDYPVRQEEVNQSVREESFSDETLLLTPSMREEWQVQTPQTEEKPTKARKRRPEKKEKENTRQLSKEVIGMLAAVGAILIAGLVLFLSLNTRSLMLSSQVQMYLIGIILMGFFSIAVLGYAKSKKQLIEETT